MHTSLAKQQADNAQVLAKQAEDAAVEAKARAAAAEQENLRLLAQLTELNTQNEALSARVERLETVAERASAANAGAIVTGLSKWLQANPNGISAALAAFIGATPAVEQDAK